MKIAPLMKVLVVVTIVCSLGSGWTATLQGKEAVTITIWNGGTLEWDPATVFQNQRFEMTYPYIKLNTLEVPFDAHESRLATALIMGASDFDVSETNEFWFGRFRDKGLFAPLDSIFTPPDLKLCPDYILEAMRSKDGQLRGFPHFINTFIFLYNTRLLEESGFKNPPRNWDELLTYGEKLTKDKNSDGVVDQWGFAFGAISGRTDPFYAIQTFMYQAGGQVLDRQGNVTLSEPEAIRALEFVVDLRNKYKIIPPGINTYTGEDISRLFNSEQVAMMLGFGFSIDRALNSPDSLVKDHFAAAMPPAGPTKSPQTVIIPWEYVVAANTPHKEAALTYVHFMASLQSQVDMLLHEPGNVVPAPAVYNYPEVQAVPYIDVLREVVERGNFFIHPQGGEILKRILIEFDNALLGKKTSKKAWDDAAEEVKKIIR